MKISYIILTCNRPDTLLYHIRSIRLQDYLCEKLEVIVADDGSTEKALFTPSGADPIIGLADKYVTTGSFDKATPAKARNMGIAAATGDLLIFADDDCLPHPLLLMIYQGIEKGYCGVGYRSSMKNRLMVDVLKSQPEDYLEPGNPQKYWERQKAGIFGATHFASGSFAIRREDLGEVRFDEEFEGYGYEDRHFAHLLAQKGIKFVYKPDAIIYHDNRAGNRPREEKQKEAEVNKKIYERKIAK